MKTIVGFPLNPIFGSSILALTLKVVVHKFLIMFPICKKSVRNQFVISVATWNNCNPICNSKDYPNLQKTDVPICNEESCHHWEKYRNFT